jgi:hypothetical protein
MSAPRLTAALLTQICNRIKAGAFEQVAVESLGVLFATYQGWLRHGEKARGGKLYRQLVSAVAGAHAQARLLPEMRLREEDAKTWLLYGPGRDSAGRPGWASAAQADRGAGGQDADQQQRLFELCAALLEALAPFPEARAAAAEAIARRQTASP